MLLKLYERTLDMIFPRRCPVCDDAVDIPGRLICSECEDVFKKIDEPYCLKCGRPVRDDALSECRECAGKKQEFKRGRAVFEYDDELKESIYRFKYGGRREYADHYAACMERSLGNWICSLKPDALVPIPLHKSRLKKRGYNQAALLAEGLGKKLGIPVRHDVLIRSSKTAVQKGLGASERQNNLKKALKIGPDVVKLKNIVLIDDIYTTGSTMNSAASCLQDAGVENVYFAVLGAANKI